MIYVRMYTNCDRDVPSIKSLVAFSATDYMTTSDQWNACQLFHYPTSPPPDSAELQWWIYQQGLMRQ